MIVLVLMAILAGSAWCGTHSHLENVVIISECRAYCLDEFSLFDRNKENCMKSDNCHMCWDMCKMVTENFQIWRNICSAVPTTICSAPCQIPCNFIKGEFYSLTSTTTLMVTATLDPHTDRVTIGWIPDFNMYSSGVVLYTVLQKDGDQEWNQIAETTSYGVQIKRGLIGLSSEILVLAVNASDKIADTGISHLGRYLYELSAEYKLKHPINIWKPHVEMIRKNAMGLETTITWPTKNGTMEYEVSWGAIEGAIEVTGHLHTTSNHVVITLWTDSIYSVQVNSLAADKTLLRQSEPLIINTNSSHVITQVRTIFKCPRDEKYPSKAFVVVFSLCISLLIGTGYWIWKLMSSRLMKNNGYNVEKTRTISGVFQSKVESFWIANNPQCAVYKDIP